MIVRFSFIYTEIFTLTALTMKLLLALPLVALSAQLASAASITFVGRADNATAVYDLTSIGDVDWAYWNSSAPATGAASNDMSGGFGIGTISGTGGETAVRSTTSTGGIISDFSYTNGSGTESGTEFNPNGMFNTNISGGGYGVELDFTLAEAGQQYEISVWTAGFATQFATVVGSIAGATSYTSGSVGGTGGSGYYGDYGNPKEQYLYTFKVIADSANDVFNFSIGTSGTTGTSRHVLINAAAIAIPEPSAYALLAGMLGLGSVMMRRRR